MFVPINRVH